MFEFNHINPAMKDPNYDNLIRRKLSSDQLDEIDKCVLLCDHCHDRVHAQNITTSMLLSVTISHEGKRKSCEQRVQGQIVNDWKDKTSTFITNERLTIWPYHVFLGSKKPRVCFGYELDTNGLLFKWLGEIDRHKSIVIRSWMANSELFRATFKGGGVFTVSHDVRYPFFEAELYEEKGKPVRVWVRKGSALTKDEVWESGTLTYELRLPFPNATT
jgi:hypothetical protein